MDKPKTVDDFRALVGRQIAWKTPRSRLTRDGYTDRREGVLALVLDAEEKPPKSGLLPGRNFPLYPSAHPCLVVRVDAEKAGRLPTYYYPRLSAFMEVLG
jgi:hypothetical protein